MHSLTDPSPQTLLTMVKIIFIKVNLTKFFFDIRVKSCKNNMYVISENMDHFNKKFIKYGKELTDVFFFLLKETNVVF